MSTGGGNQLEQNKAIVRRMLEAFNTGNTQVVTQLLDPTIQDLTRSQIQHPDLVNKPVIQKVQQEILLDRQVFSDAQFKEESCIAEGDHVVLRWSMTGTHTGKLLGRDPTGKKVRMSGAEFVRIRNGKIIEHHGQTDHAVQILQQLDMLTPTYLNQLKPEQAPP
jgi:predicted ester cyclase